ncbi:anti-sigma B factor antagonist [Thermotomaculum hydrothermale]|uniref:Anti-sigma factor antagonist n=1 Tax=Thermotomaculum hydrothermale TaxID=981385 RepID=A0A7R6PW73_9BACT|nr:STAS domain-containing protein [Thermotomaculum hydrothermale]BBB31730.1 anti-sigma B factor antagonist [Thermotomaculum hydrothermale]
MIHMEKSQDGHKITITLQGKVTFENTGEIREKMKEILREEGIKELILNMGEVSFIDSSGLGLLVSIKNTMIRKDGTFSMINLTDTVKKIMKQTGLDKYFGIN